MQLPLDEGDPLPFWQPGDRLSQSERHDLALMGGDRGHTAAGRIGDKRNLDAQTPAPTVVQELVGGNAIQPRSVIWLCTQPSKRAKGTQERFLKQVVGGRPVARQTT